MQANPMTAAVALLGSALALSALVIPASADAISDWAAKADAVATEQRESPWSRARTLAIVNVAMFEAINAVEDGDTPHKLNISADRNTSIEAAAASAAHDVLVALYPDRAPDLSARPWQRRLSQSPTTCRRPGDIRSARTRQRQSLRYGSQEPDHRGRLLRARRELPRRRAAEQRNERAPSHSITSSAVESSVGGTVRPSILAV